MREILHIFRKDVRSLWWEIAVTLLMLAALAWMEPRTTPFWNAQTKLLNGAAQSLKIMLVLGWWLLIASVVHQEPLPGDRQYWLTRPISWVRLLGAKLLFFLVFVHVPLFLADCVILAQAGFTPAEHLSGLLTKQVFTAALIVSPAVMLAAVTKGFAQMVLWAFGTLAFGILAVTVLSHGSSVGLGALSWMNLVLCAVISLAGTAATFLLQYRDRRTAWSWTVVACVAVSTALSLSLAPWETAFAIQSHLSRQPIDSQAVRVSLAPGLARPADRYRPSYPKFVPVEFALQITEVPDSLEVVCDRVAATIQTPGGEIWRSGWSTFNSAGPVSGGYWTTINVNRAFLERVKDQPVRLHGSLCLTLFGNRKTARIPAQMAWSAVPGVGFCGTAGSEPGSLRVACRYAFEGPSRLWIRLVDRETGFASTAQLRGRWSYSPLPANPGISPSVTLVVAMFQPGARSATDSWVGVFDPDRLPYYDFVFDTSESLAHIRRDFEITGIRLADYVRMTP
jgi:hypothetical protein